MIFGNVTTIRDLDDFFCVFQKVPEPDKKDPFVFLEGVREPMGRWLVFRGCPATKCPRDEVSGDEMSTGRNVRRRNVHGTKCPGQSVRGRSVQGTKCPPFLCELKGILMIIINWNAFLKHKNLNFLKHLGCQAKMHCSKFIQDTTMKF